MANDMREGFIIAKALTFSTGRGVTTGETTLNIIRGEGIRACTVDKTPIAETKARTVIAPIIGGWKL